MSVQHESPMWPEQRRFYSNSLLMYFQPSEHSGKWDILPKRVTIHVWKQHHSIPTPINTIYWNLAAAPWRCVSNTTSNPYYLLQTNLWKYLVAASIVFRYNFQVSKHISLYMPCSAFRSASPRNTFPPSWRCLDKAFFTKPIWQAFQGMAGVTCVTNNGSRRFW